MISVIIGPRDLNMHQEPTVIKSLKSKTASVWQDKFEYQQRYDCSIFRHSPAVFMGDGRNDRTTAVSYKILGKAV